MDTLILSVIGLVVSVIMTMFGLVFKRLNSMDSRLREVPSRREVSTEIEVRQEAIKAIQHEIKEDIKEMKDYLYKRLGN